MDKDKCLSRCKITVLVRKITFCTCRIGTVITYLCSKGNSEWGM